ncbi:hypothetical protein [Aquicoccus sp.]|uniref:hypothetical protein n=2 Tax=Aquicoccus sp. TaxID=2055851 RepID=UPI0035686A7B
MKSGLKTSRVKSRLGSHRARSLPVWWDAVLTVDWEGKADTTALPFLRSVLILSVAAKMPTEDLQVARGAASPAIGAIIQTVSEAIAAASTGAITDAAAWNAVRADAEEAAGGTLPNASPLWPNGVNPSAEQWAAIKWQVANSEGAADWQFWIDWYDALLAGRTMLSDPARTWEMLERVALIDPETWDKGPEVANPLIREIWELYRLRVEVAQLQAEKAALLGGRGSEAQRGHNHPPKGLVDEQPEIAQQITIVWDGLDEAQGELEKEEPDKGRLLRIGKGLLAALMKIGAYCGKVGDRVIMSAATASGPFILDHFANDGRLFQFAKDLIGFASGG